MSARYFLGLASVTLIAVAAGAAGPSAMRRLTAAKPMAADSAVNKLEGLYGARERMKRLTDSATVLFAGRLATPLKVPGSAARAIVLFVVAEDCFTCEDLGRQVREVQYHARRLGMPLLLYSPPSEHSEILPFLKRERISIDGTAPGDPSAALGSRRRLTTPAMAIVDLDGNIVKGVEHPFRLPNLRLHSFAAELGLGGISR